MLEPPVAGRAVGGLLGVVCGEAWQVGWDDGCDAGTPCASVGPVTDALIALTTSYAAGRGAPLPRGRAGGYGSESLPGRLVATAIACSTSGARAGDAREVGWTAGARGCSLDACVTYVELGSALLEGQPVLVAVEAATGSRTLPPPDTLPLLSGDPAIDALQIGRWVLTHPACGITDIVPTVITLAGPSMAAAVGGLLGLRDGVCCIPHRWRRHVARTGAQCSQLVARLRSLAPAQDGVRGQASTAVGLPSCGSEDAWGIPGALTSL